MSTHADLVDRAQALFPGATSTTWTYEAFRDALYALVKRECPEKTTQERLGTLYRLAAAQACHPTRGPWGRQLFEEELPALEERLRAAGALS